MDLMKRLAPLLLVPLLALAGCTTPAPPAGTAAPPVPAGAEQAQSADSAAATPEASPAGTPDPLPAIPERVANEIVRATFDADAPAGETATHEFSGQMVTVHVLCRSHDGVVDVTLLVDGEEQILSTNACDTPSYHIEDDSFPAGSHEVQLQVEPSGGAQGVAYLVEGDI